jgi:hypothetical protein
MLDGIDCNVNIDQQKMDTQIHVPGCEDELRENECENCVELAAGEGEVDIDRGFHLGGFPA